ncbi:MAG TPA: hypothetical protein VF960_08190 [Chloroflexota bacterium]
MAESVTELLERHRAFWRREKVDRPLVAVKPYAPLAPKYIPLRNVEWGSEDLCLDPTMFDPRTIANAEQWHNKPGQLLLGDSFSLRQPYVRIPWVEGILGCPIWADRESGSIWSKSYLSNPGTGGIGFNREHPWLRLLLELTRLLVEEADGSYLVAQTLMRGPIDMVRAVLGDEEMCLAIYDDPDALRQLLSITTDVFIEVAKAQQAIVPRFHGGYASYYGIWAPGTVVRTQCDMSSVLSASTYAELVIPFEERICRQFDHSMIHLHSGYLHTVDALLEAEFPQVLQIALDTGSTPVTTRDLVPTCRKILERKPLIIEGYMTRSDFEYLLESLPPHGLYIIAMLDPAELLPSER